MSKTFAGSPVPLTGDREIAGPYIPDASRAGEGPFARLLELAARDWRTSRALIVIALFVPALAVGIGLASAVLGKDMYKWYVDEDGFAENLQVIAFAIGGVFSLLAASRLNRRGDQVLGTIFFVMGIGLVLVVGEEVSWGQRIFGWSTPVLLNEANRQSESNLHNIFGVETALRWAQFAVGAWGAILPIVLLRRPGLFRNWWIDVSRLVPHFVLVPYFACTLLWRAYRNVAPPPSSHRFFFAHWSEVMELNLALGIMLFLYYQWRTATRSESA
jgi:hypothetical protein